MGKIQDELRRSKALNQMQAMRRIDGVMLMRQLRIARETQSIQLRDRAIWSAVEASDPCSGIDWPAMEGRCLLVHGRPLADILRR